jgi:hypothetical protein
VAYGEVDGRGVIFVSTPAFFLHALDAKIGRHLEDWGSRVRIPAKSSTGSGLSGPLIPVIPSSRSEATLELGFGG